MDLVPATTPKGIVAFFNIFPALLVSIFVQLVAVRVLSRADILQAKVFWPLISVGQIQYRRRVGFCTAISWSGIVVRSSCFAPSPSSLQLHTRVLTRLSDHRALAQCPRPPVRHLPRVLFQWPGRAHLPPAHHDPAHTCGQQDRTGSLGERNWRSWCGWRFHLVAAARVGCEGWTRVIFCTSATPRLLCLLATQFLPLLFPFTYYYVLPPWDALHTTGPAPYQALSTGEDEASTSSDIERAPPSENDALAKPGHPEVYLTPREKLDLLKPLVVRYMLPLCLVYIEEYVINSVGR